MPNNPKNILPYSESILLLEDGFCFCSPGVKSFFPFSDFGSKSIDSVTQFIEQQSPLPTSIALVTLDAPAVFVPAIMYNDTDQDLYWTSFAQPPQNTQLETHTTSNGLIKIVFPKPSLGIETLEKKGITIRYSPAMALLFDHIIAHSQSDFSKQMYIHLYQGHFHLFVTQGTRVLLANRFPHQNEEDFMYYLFYVAEQLQVAEHSSKIYFLGKYSQYQAYYEGVEKFQNEIHFLENSHLSPLGASDPIPYWHA